MKAAVAVRQNRVAGRRDTHQARQRATVRRSMPSLPDSRRRRAAVTPCCRALINVTIVAR